MGRAEHRLGFPTPGEEIQAPSKCAKHRELPWCHEARAGGGGLHVLVLTWRLQHSSPSPEPQIPSVPVPPGAGHSLPGPLGLTAGLQRAAVPWGSCTPSLEGLRRNTAARILSRARKPHPGIQLISTETPNHSCSERWLSTYSFRALGWRRVISMAPAAGQCLCPGGARPCWDPVGSGQPQPCPGKVLLFQTRPNCLPKHPSSNSGWKPPRGRLCSTRVLSHLGVTVLWDNTHSRGVFLGVSQAGGHSACPGVK